MNERSLQDLKNITRSIDKCIDKEKIFMDNGSIINFLDHISSYGDNCNECAEAMAKYTNKEVIRVGENA